MSNIDIIKTSDGSNTLYLKDLDESYHSKHGAIQESEHVFINNGLRLFLEKTNLTELHILEYGFGTGLNAFLTKINCPSDLNVYYTSLDKYPLPKEVSSNLNYHEQLGNQPVYEAIHHADWDHLIDISETFHLLKVKTDFRDFTTGQSFDIIFFDAFAPSKQPELWTSDILQLCYNALTLGGVFVTYSAKGQLKRDLKTIGFTVETLPGPPGKFEMVRAIKGE